MLLNQCCLNTSTLVARHWWTELPARHLLILPWWDDSDFGRTEAEEIHLEVRLPFSRLPRKDAVRLGKNALFPRTCTLEVRALSRLRQLLVRRRRHVPPYLNQHRLHREVALPHADARHLGEVDFAAPCIDAREVDFGGEGHFGRFVGVVWAAVDLEGVDAVFVHALGRC